MIGSKLRAHVTTYAMARSGHARSFIEDRRVETTSNNRNLDQ